MFLVCFLVCPSGFPGAITTSEPWKHPLGAERMLARIQMSLGLILALLALDWPRATSMRRLPQNSASLGVVGNKWGYT